MFRLVETSMFACAMFFAANAAAQDRFAGIGRAATPAEIKAWDIDVRGDLAGLPPGSGSVKQGEPVWEGKCASCHGSFGEANHAFPPIVGGTTAKDMATGRVAALISGTDGRTTLMKLSRISTLWDYINRAMPWNAPKTLTHDEVYAVTAYILHLGNIVPGDFTLSQQNMAEVQAKLPNRNGKTLNHGLSRVAGTPDVRNTACMKNCVTEARITSFLPEYVRDAHGNLATQQRLVGGLRGVETVRHAAGETKQLVVRNETGGGHELARKHACTACHGLNNTLVGPSLREIAGKYRGDSGAEDRLLARVKTGGAGVWGSVPMPPQSHIVEADLRLAVKWILSGAKE